MDKYCICKDSISIIQEFCEEQYKKLEIRKDAVKELIEISKCIDSREFERAECLLDQCREQELYVENDSYHILCRIYTAIIYESQQRLLDAAGVYVDCISKSKHMNPKLRADLHLKYATSLLDYSDFQKKNFPRDSIKESLKYAKELYIDAQQEDKDVVLPHMYFRNWALFYYMSGDLIRYLLCSQRHYHACCDAYPENNINVVASCMNLGTACMLNEKFVDAKKYLQRAMRLVDRQSKQFTYVTILCLDKIISCNTHLCVSSYEKLQTIQRCIRISENREKYADIHIRCLIELMNNVSFCRHPVVMIHCVSKLLNANAKYNVLCPRLLFTHVFNVVTQLQHVGRHDIALHILWCSYERSLMNGGSEPFNAIGELEQSVTEIQEDHLQQLRIDSDNISCLLLLCKVLHNIGRFSESTLLIGKIQTEFKTVEISDEMTVWCSSMIDNVLAYNAMEENNIELAKAHWHSAQKKLRDNNVETNLLFLDISYELLALQNNNFIREQSPNVMHHLHKLYNTYSNKHPYFTFAGFKCLQEIEKQLHFYNSQDPFIESICVVIYEINHLFAKCIDKLENVVLV